MRAAVLVLPAVVAAGCSPMRPAPPPETSRTVEVGNASWYGDELRGGRTASGERFDPSALTGASKTLPIGTRVRVTNLENRRSTVVRINDRGPFARGRVLDVSHAAARELGMVGRGTARVKIGVVDGGGSSRAVRGARHRRRRRVRRHGR